MQFQVLGPLEIQGEHGAVRVNGRRRRALLATLLVQPGAVVSVDGLIDAVWGDRPPSSAVANIRTYVYDLRRTLTRAGDNEARLASHPAGYRLTVAADELDLVRFRALAAQGYRALKDGESALAADEFGLALDLWHGHALDDVSTAGPVLAAQAVALDEEHHAAQCAWVDARLALGRYDQLVPTLRRMVAERPLAERCWTQLVETLHAAGRTPEAVHAYHQARETLAEELGVEPGDPLRQAYGAVLDGHGPAADGSPVPDRPVSVAAVPRSLPPRPANFVGRETTRRRLLAIGETVSGRHHAPARAGVAAISGAPGMGKSSLALTAAYDLARYFPDGQLYVSLDGSTGTPRPVGDALGELLTVLGFAPAAIPAGDRERSALFRSAVADRRLLLVLDDAAGADAVRPLLPGLGRCLVLVTSRVQLNELDSGWRCTLGPLSDDEAVRLLAGLAGRDRVQATPQASARIVAACERVPLALRIAGTRLTRHPGTTGVSTVAELLADEDRRLTELAVEGVSVRSRLSQYCRALDPTIRRALRALGRNGAARFTESTAAHVLGVPRGAVDRVMEGLVRHNLVTCADGGQTPYYQMSPLLGVYARDCAELDAAA